MITLFAIPKPFRDRADIHQRNALESWLAMAGRPRIVLAGDDPGVKEVCAEYGVEHLPEVARNEWGTPLLGEAFRSVAARAPGGTLLCYVNADIILPPDLPECANAIRWKRFVMVCRRRDVEVNERLAFGATRIGASFGRLAAAAGPLERPTAMDLFVFPNRPEFVLMPDFAVGRQGWDNWFVLNAWRRGAAIVDATPAITIYHQLHGYAHVPHAVGSGNWGGPESRQNAALAGEEACMWDIRDATHRLVGRRVVPARDGDNLERRVERMRLYRPGLFRLLGCWRLRYLLGRLLMGL